MSSTETAALDAVMRERKTVKVLSAQDLPAHDCSAVIQELLDLAGMAPFHRACEEQHREGGLTGIEPWRYHVLLAEQCRVLRGLLPTKEAGKIPSMLASADALLIATWLPNRSEGDPSAKAIFEPTLGNMEHIAAASASIQNLLLAATARGIHNYWSSGGVLRQPEVFQMLGIPTIEILLGAVFLFPAEYQDAEVVGSKLRARRTPSHQWSRQIRVTS